MSEDDEVAQAATARQEAEGGGELDDAALARAREDVVRDREAALAKKLNEMRHRKRDLVDPVQYAVSIGASDLLDYAPAFGTEAAAPSQAQIDALAKVGIYPSDVQTAGMAEAILSRVAERRDGGFATPKQVRRLEQYGWTRAGQMPKAKADALIRRIAANGWRLPDNVRPE